ncbi:hypothetical protein RUND412_004383 [Rhizina undulata]
MATHSSSGTTFKLRTPPHINACHLVGSWDNYVKRYVMAQDSHAGSGWWTLTLKLPSSGPKRYAYYYILDGYFESHNPNEPNYKEPSRNLTLNILDMAPSSPVPSSAHSSRSSRSSSSSRFPSPTSSVGTSPTSSISSSSDKRSLLRNLSASSKPTSTRPTISNPIFQNGTTMIPEDYSRYSHSTYAPPQQASHPSAHIIHPKPRNPLANHKLTIDTDYRPYSVITNAATVASNGSSPVSASSSRSNSSLGSICSSCSGSSYSSSPTTPICNCQYTAGHRGGECDYSECESEGESCCSESSDEYVRTRVVRRGVERRKSYHPSVAGDSLAYDLERRLRV